VREGDGAREGDGVREGDGAREGATVTDRQSAPGQRAAARRTGSAAGVRAARPAHLGVLVIGT